MRKLAFAIVCLALFSCDFNTNRYNAESDRDRAIAVSDKLFNYLDFNKYERADELFSNKFLKETPADTLHVIYDISKQVLETSSYGHWMNGKQKL